MAEAVANGVRLYYEVQGNGDPLVLVHGSWADARDWQLVEAELAESFRVLAYDRRGHSRSERPASAGSVEEDADDLAALLETLGMPPAHVVTNSFGGIVALRLAARRPELCRSVCCHEPPLWSLLAGDAESEEILQQGARDVRAVIERIAAGDHEGAARQFVDSVALGTGAWDLLPAEVRATVTANAPTFLDEIQDQTAMTVDPEGLAGLRMPVHLTRGSDSPPVFIRVVERLAELIPGATSETITGAGHVPHLQTPERYVEVTTRAVLQAA